MEIIMDDGRRIKVNNGDLLLTDIAADDSATFLDHDPAYRTMH